jgi:5'(3')-deoxyribonucleotidase
MNYNLTVVLDMDNTVFDLHSPWLEWYNNKYGDSLTTKDIETWDWDKFVVPEARGKVYEFLQIEGMFESLVPYPAAMEQIEQAHKKGVKHVFATICTTKTGAWEKMKCIDTHFPYIGHKNVLISGGYKGHVHGDLMVDDAPHNLHHFHDTTNGLTCLADLHGSPYCKDATASFKMTSWNDYPSIVEAANYYMADKRIYA